MKESSKLMVAVFVVIAVLVFLGIASWLWSVSHPSGVGMEYGTGRV